PVAGVGRGPGGAAQRLRRRRIPLQRLLVETSGSRRVTRAQGEIGEGDAIARVARLARERLVHAPRERDGGSAAVGSRPLGFGGELAAEVRERPAAIGSRRRFGEIAREVAFHAVEPAGADAGAAPQLEGAEVQAAPL